MKAAYTVCGKKVLQPHFLSGQAQKQKGGAANEQIPGLYQLPASGKGSEDLCFAAQRPGESLRPRVGRSAEKQVFCAAGRQFFTK